MKCENCGSEIVINEENVMISQGILFLKCENCEGVNTDIDLVEDALLELYMDSKE